MAVQTVASSGESEKDQQEARWSEFPRATRGKPLAMYATPTNSEPYGAEGAPRRRGPQARPRGAPSARAGASVVVLRGRPARPVVLAALVVGAGQLLVHVLLPFHGLGGQDERVNAWCAATGSALDTATYVGSSIGDVPVLPVLVAIAVVALAVLRRWRVAAFILGGIVVEVVDLPCREPDRPPPPARRRAARSPARRTRAIPSGHVAASVVVYLSLALMVTA